MKAIMYDGPRDLKVIEVPRLTMREDQIRLRSLYSGVSHGTEMNVYRGLAPFFRKKQDPEMQEPDPASVRIRSSLNLCPEQTLGTSCIPSPITTRGS